MNLHPIARSQVDDATHALIYGSRLPEGSATRANCRQRALRLLMASVQFMEHRPARVVVTNGDRPTLADRYQMGTALLRFLRQRVDSPALQSVLDRAADEMAMGMVHAMRAARARPFR